MTKTLALLLDSYRELNAKRLFWIVLVISALVVGAFSLVGIKGGTITVLWWDTPFSGQALTMIKPELLYKLMFSYFGVGFWLTWIANILALISTAGIFPDFMAGGSIDLYLSKPISRLRLFPHQIRRRALVRYAASHHLLSLLFHADRPARSFLGTSDLPVDPTGRADVQLPVQHLRFAGGHHAINHSRAAADIAPVVWPLGRANG